MSKAHYFYFKSSLTELERLVKEHQDDFEALLNDTFSEAELLAFEPFLDNIAALYVQPIFSELTFEDFYADEEREAVQRSLFEACQSSICLDNIPELSGNPFQVTYLIELLRVFDEVLIDRGGVSSLQFKKDYVEHLKTFKNIFSLVQDEAPKPKDVKTTKPVDPIDFLILDVYKEMDRLGPEKLVALMGDQSEKVLKAYSALSSERTDASDLLRRSGLGAKDFDDTLEKIKFFLRRS